MRRYEFHPEARSEYLHAVAFYEYRQSGLGGRFTLEIESAIDQILEAPESGRILERHVRRRLARRFPFGILYTIEEESILIVAIMHCSRKPGYWRDRLPPRGG